MIIKSNSVAYAKGLKSEYYHNPYQVGSDEYNDCDRGWASRIKRGYRCSPTNSNRKRETKNLQRN